MIGNKKKTYNLEKTLFYFCIIDMLFLPYIRFLSIKASMIIVAIWYLNGGFKKAFTRKSFNRFLMFIILSSISVLLGTVINYQNYGTTYLLVSNAKIIVITWFSYLFLYYYIYNFKKYNIKLEKILIFYLSFAFVSAILFWVDPQTFYDLRRFWTLGNENILFLNISTTRFMHIASEPNNFSAMIIAIVAYLRYVEEISRIKMYYVYIISYIIIVTAMSTTGMFMFISLIIIGLFQKRKTVTRIKLSKILIFSINIFVLFILIIFFKENILSFFSSDVFKSAQLRYDSYLKNNNYSGSRIRIWNNLLNSINIIKYIIVGRGTNIISKGISYKPHNGHLFLIYGYGMIAYLMYMFEFFIPKKNTPIKNYLAVTLPFLIIFTMNTMLGDLRCVFLFVLLLAKVVAKNSNEFILSD